VFFLNSALDDQIALVSKDYIRDIFGRDVILVVVQTLFVLSSSVGRHWHRAFPSTLGRVVVCSWRFGVDNVGRFFVAGDRTAIFLQAWQCRRHADERTDRPLPSIYCQYIDGNGPTPRGERRRAGA